MQSNMKETGRNSNFNESKHSRKSSSNIFVPRSTTFSAINKLNDPRPIKEAAFQDECITKVCDFLIKTQYDKVISKRDLMSPQAKDFNQFFSHIISKIRPDWNFTITKLDEDVIQILQELRYPGHITKNHLIAVGAPNTWPHLLAVLAWLAELHNYLDASAYAEEQDTQNLNINEYLSDNICSIEDVISKHNQSSLETQHKIFEQEYKDFLYEGYKQNLNKGDNFLATETFQKKTEELLKFNYSNTDKLLSEADNLNKLNEELERNYPTLSETKLKLEIATRDLNTVKSNLNSQEKKLNELSTLAESKSKLYDSKCEKYNEDLRTVEELDICVKNQKVSYEDYEKMKHSKAQLEKQHQNLNVKKQEYADALWNIKNEIESKFITLNEQVKLSIMISDKLFTNKEQLVDILIFTHLDNITNLDMTDCVNKFNESCNYIVSEINVKRGEVKEKQLYMINLSAEMRKLEDKNKEAIELLNQAKMEHEKENKRLQSEKDKFNQLSSQKNEEIEKIDETSKKLEDSLPLKDKDIEEMKRLEISLQEKILQAEELVLKFIKELEEVYIEAFEEIRAKKKENVLALRNTHRNMTKMFEGLTKVYDEICTTYN